MEEAWTPLKLIHVSRAYLERRGVENARREAEELLAHGLGISRLDLYLEHDRPLGEPELKRCRELVRLRGQRRPLQYLLGSQPFRSAELRITSQVLIPRPETEELVGLGVEREGGRPGPLRVLDAGTGSGCIAISLALELPGCLVRAVDLDEKVLELAAENARRNGVAERIRFEQLDLLDRLPDEPAEVMVSNPPYVPHTQRGALQPELSYEPAAALFDGHTDGTGFFRRFAGDLSALLVPGGRLYFEFGAGQEEVLRGLFEPLCEKVELHADLSGRIRFLTATLRTA